MPLKNFSIGATSTLTNIETMTSKKPGMYPRHRYAAYTELVGLDSGGARGIGSPNVIWYYGFMYLDMWNALKVICPGPSADVYIRTEVDYSGTEKYYTATMILPDENNLAFQAGMYQDVTITFTNLVEYTPAP